MCQRTEATAKGLCHHYWPHGFHTMAPSSIISSCTGGDERNWNGSQLERWRGADAGTTAGRISAQIADLSSHCHPTLSPLKSRLKHSLASSLMSIRRDKGNEIISLHPSITSGSPGNSGGPHGAIETEYSRVVSGRSLLPEIPENQRSEKKPHGEVQPFLTL